MELPISQAAVTSTWTARVSQPRIFQHPSPDDISGDLGMGACVGYNIDDARPFTGLMDEFRMFTRALSQDEILEIMQGM
jgi:hypothetical protein